MNLFFHRRLVPRERVLSLRECAAVAVVRGAASHEGRFGFLVAFPLVSAAKETTGTSVASYKFTIIHAVIPRYPLVAVRITRMVHIGIYGGTSSADLARLA